MKRAIVFLATYYGRKHGGINVVNYGLCNSLHNSDLFFNNVVCITPNKENPYKTTDGVLCYNIGSDRNEFEENDKYIINKILEDEKIEPICFVGHDIKTGFIAISCSIFFQVKSFVFHHMDYSSYDSFKEDNPDKIKEKQKNQIKVLNEADFVIPVGPKLEKSALDKIDNNVDKIIKFIPGLPKINSKENSNHNFSMLTFGRFGSGVDLVKQYHTPLEAFALCFNRELINQNSKIYVIGINNEIESKELKKFVSDLAERLVSVNAYKYEEDEELVFSDLKTHSLCVMPSIHEGFGLTGWESIAAGVPLILTNNSGLWDFLDSLNMNIKGIEQITIKGGNSKDDDVKTMSNLISKIYNNNTKYKNEINKLKEDLYREYNWDKCCEKFIKDIKKCGVDIYDIFSPYVQENNSFKNSFFLAKNYLNNGDFVSSKNLYLNNMKFEEAEFDKQLNVIVIEQKYGLLNDAKKHIDFVFKQGSFKTLDLDTKNSFELVNFKINSQLEDHLWVIKNYESILECFIDSDEIKRFSIYNRSALAFAATGNLVEANKCLKNAQTLISSKTENSTNHIVATSLMYKTIIDFFCNKNINASDSILNIRKCQQLYFAEEIKNKHIKLWQVHNLKSIVQCLFCEASINFYNENRSKAFLQLVAGNLLTASSMSSPYSEGYSSLLSVIKDNDFKELLKLSMTSGLKNRNDFQKNNLINNLSEILIKLEPIIFDLNKDFSFINWTKFLILIDNE